MHSITRAANSRASSMTIATICRISLLCIFWIASACQSERAPPRFPEPMRQASPDLTCRTCCPPPDPPPDPPPPPTCDPVACSDLDSGCVINRCSSGVCRAGTAPAGTVCQPATTGYNAAVCDGVKSTCPAPTCATGYKTCTATSSCIAQAACCPGGDCPLPFSDNFASGTAPEWTAVWGTGVSVAPNQLRLVNFTRVDAGMQSWSSYSGPGFGNLPGCDEHRAHLRIHPGFERLLPVRGRQRRTLGDPASDHGGRAE